MKEDFFKFPSTPHLLALPGADVRDDKVLSASGRDEFLQHNLVVEEKVDGANLGISFDSEGNVRAQNRGTYLRLPETGQWKKLEGWLSPRISSLFDSLSDRYILFGEWCFARHSVFYERLPDWFLGFDIYDKEAGLFFSSGRRDAMLKKMQIAKVPFIAQGQFTYPDLRQFLSQSKLADQPAEGLYLRFDRDENWLGKRAKLVRTEFIQSIEQHWSRSAIKPNHLSMDAHG